MDKLNIGMVNYQNFLKIMEKPVMIKEAVVSNDNYKW